MSFMFLIEIPRWQPPLDILISPFSKVSVTDKTDRQTVIFEY
jgi:hypothetical protein